MGMEFVKGDTFVHRLTPYTKLLYITWVLAFSMILYDITTMLLYTGFSLVLWQLARIKGIFQRFRLVFLAAAGTGALWVVAQGFFFFHNVTPLFTLFELAFESRVYGTFYLEGFLYGLAMSLKIAVVIAVVPILTLTTSVPDIIVAMHKAHIPYKFNFAFSTAFRFAPLILTSIGTIQEAQTLRAHNIEEMGYLDKIRKAYVPIVIPLFISLLRRSDELQIALESRAFGAPVKRTFVNEVKFTWRDLVLILFMIGMGALTIQQVFLTGNGSIFPVEWLPPWLWPQR